MVTEAEVKESLRTQLMASVPTTAEAVYEFWVPQTNERADVAVISTTIDGFEIKTERDSLKRLPRQTEAYGRVFDRCHAVLAYRHVDLALEILPPWWGVLAIDSDLNFVTLRVAEPNANVDPQTLVRLLWRDEAYAALTQLGTPPDIRSGRFRLWQLLLALLDVEGIKRVVRDALLKRDRRSVLAPSQPISLT
jgi:hypothetical protein